LIILLSAVVKREPVAAMENITGDKGAVAEMVDPVLIKQQRRKVLIYST
jgi:hypothetical protein